MTLAHHPFPAILSRPLAWLLAAVYALVLSERAYAIDPSTQDYGTKAQFLFNFTKYFDFPKKKFSTPDAPIVIGFIGAPWLQDRIEEANPDRVIEGRKIVVKSFAANSDITRCHILFVGHSEHARLKSILTDARRNSVLTVGDSDEFIRSGGMVNFFADGGKVRFQINYDTVRKASIRASSHLSGVGIPVNNEGRPLNPDPRLAKP